MEMNALNARHQNEVIAKAITSNIKSIFPIVGRYRTLSLEDTHVDIDDAPTIDFPTQKELKLTGKSWEVPLTANVLIKDNVTGEIVERSKLKIANIPKISPRFSTIIKGNEYQTVNQFRLKSGVYTREKENGQFESQFNLEKGFNFKLNFDPQKQIFFLSLGNQNYHLYTLLRALATPDSEMLEAWGKPIFDKNQRAGLNAELTEIPQIYKKVRHRDLPFSEALAGLKKYFSEETKISPETTKITLGDSFETVTPKLFLRTSKKLLSVVRGDEPSDERDSLIFKELYSVDDLLKAHFEARKEAIGRSIKYRLDTKTNPREIISTETFNKPILEFFYKGELSSTPTQTNPIDILTEWRKTTIMGVGGVRSEHAITDKMRDVHPSHMGFLDAVSTTEGNPGITLNLTMGVSKDPSQKLRTPIVTKDGKRKFASPFEIYNLKIGFPDQYRVESGQIKAKSRTVKAVYKGKATTFPASQIDAYIERSTNLFTWSSNLIPFLNYNAGGRAMYGSKQMAQAVPIKYNEAPLVQVRVPERILAGKKESRIPAFETVVGNYLNPRVSEGWDGTVSRITKDYVYIKSDETGKTNKYGLYNMFPLNQESFLHSTPVVKVGDQVKRGDYLATNNFQKDNTLALGANLLTAYMPWKGQTFDDSVIISESAAEKLTSLHLYKEELKLSKNGISNIDKYNAYFPGKLKPANVQKLDVDGIIQEGEIIEPGEYVAVYMEPRDLTDEERILRSMRKVLSEPYIDRSLTWTHEVPGEVLYVRTIGKHVVITIKTEAPAVIGDKLCVDEKTEMLTNSGWKYWYEIKSDDKFCTINPETQKIQYEEFSAFHVFDHIGEMYQISNNLIDQCVVLDHKMVVRLRDKENFELIPAKDIIGKRVEYLKTGSWAGTDDIVPENLQKWFNAKNYIKFLAWFIAEGYVSRDKKNYRVIITQDPDFNFEKCELIKALLQECNLHYYQYKEKITINSKELYYALLPLGKAINKTVPKELDNASPELLKLFIETYILGDGCQNQIITSSIFMRDKLQEFALKAGWSSNFVLKIAKGAPYTIKGRSGFANSDCWKLSIIRSKNTPQVNHGHTKSQKIQKECIISDYEGKVFCPTVPNGTVYIRRNGKTSWTGNTNRAGTKGIISKIVPNDLMPQTEDGRPVEYIISPLGYPGRTNTGQILETAAGKIAEKTGKPYLVQNFDDINYLDQIKKDLKKHGLKAEEKLLDGIDGSEFENPVLVGPQHVYKLRHTIEHKFNARSHGKGYSVDEQPVGGTPGGGASLDVLQHYSMLAHGAKSNIYDSMAVKGQRNDEYWRAIALGLPAPPPKQNFVYDKFKSLMQGAGVDLIRQGNHVKFVPFTDKQLLKVSAGKLDNAGYMLKGKNLAAIKGGLFDPILTGGVHGEKFTHIELTERLPNPMYEGAVKTLLGLTEPEYEKILTGVKELDGKTGTKAVISALKNYDIEGHLADAKVGIKVTKNKAQINKLNKRIRYLEALKTVDLKPFEAYTMKYVPVLPPKFRPINPLPSGDLVVAPINEHYRDIAILDNSLIKEKELGDEDRINKITMELYNGLRAAQGHIDPVTFKKAKYEGILKTLGGVNSPKHGFIQDKMWKKRQDLSGRTTITLEPDLGLDEIGIPDEMAKKVYKPFIIRELVKTGVKPIDALQQYQDWSSLADRALENVMRERPVLLNRAPSLHKWSVQAFIPVRHIGKDIKFNPIVQGFNQDYDGDAMNVYVPVSPDSVDEAWAMLPSRNIFHPSTDPFKPDLIHSLGKEYLLGLYHMTRPGKVTKKVYKTVKEAMKAEEKNEISVRDTVKIGRKTTTLGRELLNKELPGKISVDKKIDAKYLKQVFAQVGQSYPQDVTRVMNAFKDYGKNYGHKFATSISLDDFHIPENRKNEIMSKYKTKYDSKMSDKKKGELWVDMTNELFDANIHALKTIKRPNNFSYIVDSGAISGGKAINVNQILTSIGAVKDLSGNPLPVPITGNWGEGLDTWEYWQQMYGSRKGVVDKAINTRDSGELNKNLLSNTKGVLITEEDCETLDHIVLDSDDKSLLGRHLATNIVGVGKRNTVIDPSLHARLRAKGIMKIKVRSPLTCDAVNGICQMCYGIMPDGKVPSLGYNVGVMDSQALSERSTQLTLSSFHSGASAAGGAKTMVASFSDFNEILQVPEILPGKATLATKAGIVNSVRKHPAGGHEVFIDGVSHYVPTGLGSVARVGTKVKPGDKLSEGKSKPQELAKLKDFKTAQLDMVKRIKNVYNDDFHARAYETVIRGISDLARLTHVPDDIDNMYIGDTLYYSLVKKLNKERAVDGKELIGYEPYFKAINVQHQDRDDVLAQMSGSHIKANLIEAAARMRSTNIHGKDPLPGLLYATEFGKDTNPSEGQFY